MEHTPTPTWAITPQNQNATKLKYQHLLTALRRRIQSAIENGNQSLVRELQQELALLEREI
jgi:hypothetical protein